MAFVRPRTPGTPTAAPRPAAQRPTRRRGPRPLTALASGLGLLAGSLGLWAAGGSAAADTAAGLPAPDHVVVVVLENHAYTQVIGSSSAPYINGTLVAGGAKLTRSYALTHPSQPNYYMLFSGSSQGIVDDSCVDVGALQEPNLASELLASGQTWASYNEGLPAQGATDCRVDSYAQKHNPWFGFGNVPTDSAYGMDAFPSDYSTLPKLSFVVPDLCDDMHDCSVGTGDSWLSSNLDGYAQWAKSHNSLLVVTFDEDNRLSGNRIPTLLYGAHVAPGSSTATTYNHYDLLHTLEDLTGVNAHAGNSSGAADITGIWN
ncbi:alkaline phosphatase family protein [Streptomyces sp. 1331.2]|uniref:alkaline phosphatase family protein n=1 Tax=Streptomyces sp. 1331.2 TaxID=1938835 RepID=UPI000BCD20FA|nr:alkaline phosphatase family protein [Streptomyces sp. 1331.2]SOB81514.1 Phosphoesterase family protein [Streptomyces sp. 1331.2]